MERGYEVTVLEASRRTGGHVQTIHDPLPDSLYADVGAEQFTNPGYDMYREWVRKFDLPVQAKSRFWEGDNVPSINFETGNSTMSLVYECD